MYSLNAAQSTKRKFVHITKDEFIRVPQEKWVYQTPENTKNKPMSYLTVQSDG